MALNEVTRTFTTPIKVGAITSTHKLFYEGDIDGIDFELSVLPGLHQESFDQARAQFKSLLATRNFDQVDLYPSVRFALEAWQFKRDKLDQTHPWNKPVSLNALLLTASLSALESARTREIKSFKVKIGRGESANDLLSLCQALKSDERLRLDGNRLISPQALTKLLAPLESYWHLIDYVEEPFSDTDQLITWDHPVKLAIDESLPDYLKNPLPKGVCAVVLKPSLFGFNKSIEIIKKFNSLGVPVTLSSSFEGPVGLAAITTLSSLQNSIQPIPAGLDTLIYFV